MNLMVALFGAMLLAFSGSLAHSEVKGENSIRFEVVKYKLKNGLTVLLHEDHSVPTLSYHTWFRVGSRDEKPGTTGIAHLFEHMMFKGAKRYTGEQFDRLLQANGATNNAFTSHDYTGYYENLPSHQLELVMDIESDRMVNLRVNKEVLQTEREVVKEERRMRVDNSIIGKLQEAVYSTVFKVHPYRWPVIGWMKDINRISVENCREFYEKFYSPNNAVLVIAGDIDIDQTRQLVDRYYGPLIPSKIEDKKFTKEPEQRGYRHQRISKNVQSDTFALVYKGVAAGEKEAYALDLLSNIIGEGSSSRLHKKLVYKQRLATSVSSYNFTPSDRGVFEVIVSMQPGASYEEARKSTLGVIFQVRNKLVSESELQKAKNQIMKSLVDSLKTVHGKAHSLALNEIIFGDYERLFTDLDRYSQVTPKMIKEVAEKYLVVEKANFILVGPKVNKVSASQKEGTGV